jgi:phosphoglycolate phosphatase
MVVNRLALFDCDGTLVDSAANICRAMEACFAEAGLAVPLRAQIRRIVGLSLVPAIAVLLPDADAGRHAALAESYRRSFFAIRSSGGMAEEPLFDGIAEAIDTLEAAGWKLGVATGKSDRGLNHILDHHGLKHRFVTLQTADRHPSKPHPSMIGTAMAEAGASPETTAMIGDTSFDMAMARAAGAHAIGVGWGYHDTHELTAAGAHHIASTARELTDYLEGL